MLGTCLSSMFSAESWALSPKSLSTEPSSPASSPAAIFLSSNIIGLVGRGGAGL